MNILNVANIDNEKNFWLVRTKKGFFYNEYISKSFIALGWNTIDANVLKRTKTKEDEKKLKSDISEKYKAKLAGQIYNKCRRFVEEIKDGDIVMIPSANNEQITFAEVGKYYEESDMDYSKEIEVINRIDSGIDYGTQVICPYKKRREIKVIKTIEGERMNPNLYRVLASYHGLSKINDYSDFILRSIFILYVWNNKLNLVIPIETKKDIDTLVLSEFIYGVSKSLKIEDDRIRITGKVDLNSPGDFQFIIDNAVEFLTSPALLGSLASIVATICSGKYGPEVLKSLLNFINDWRKTTSQLKNEEQERELKKIEIEKERLELEKQKLDLYNSIALSSNTLEVNTDIIENVINISDYTNQKLNK
ncbi:hypothetical protein [Clostridium sp.]|uniref:hypothetical protein n=1 Tax=Clostridium sp. TaxID=1506 RepID=UPI0029079025|nr:hypothetical protein [Clostridium sp.]MDU4728323.1 hypothetical protein [Clostridium sp.]